MECRGGIPGVTLSCVKHCAYWCANDSQCLMQVHIIMYTCIALSGKSYKDVAI